MGSVGLSQRLSQFAHCLDRHHHHHRQRDTQHTSGATHVQLAQVGAIVGLCRPSAVQARAPRPYERGPAWVDERGARLGHCAAGIQRRLHLLLQQHAHSLVRALLRAGVRKGVPRLQQVHRPYICWGLLVRGACVRECAMVCRVSSRCTGPAYVGDCLCVCAWGTVRSFAVQLDMAVMGPHPLAPRGLHLAPRPPPWAL